MTTGRQAAAHRHNVSRLAAIAIGVVLVAVFGGVILTTLMRIFSIRWP